MKLFLIIITALIFNTAFGQIDKEVLRYYEKVMNKADTSYYYSAIQNDKGYRFVFPELTSRYYKLKDSVKMLFDTIFVKTKSEVGPYKFLKRRNKILFKDVNRSKKFFDLYNISKDEFLAPNLLSSSTDSYEILTKLLDSNAVLRVGSQDVSCFKFLQKMVYDYSKEYRLLYIDKKSLLPYKFEYYADKNLKNMVREVFAVIN
jgi:hypothetical protein